MASQFFSVYVSELGPKEEFIPLFDCPLELNVDSINENLHVRLKKDETVVMDFFLDRFSECCRVSKCCYTAVVSGKSITLRFRNENEMVEFHKLVSAIKYGKKGSVFSERTDDSSASQYFTFYGLLSQQQNMLQDYVRTSTYHKAILANNCDFEDKVVLDVGAGSGVLSFFAVQAGARRVYAVEASSMAQHAETLVAANNLQDKIKVVAGKIEEIELPEMVDVIVSEPIGYMLFNERMLETFLYAKKWLKKGGFIFPSRGDLHVAPFSDEALYMELTSKISFWDQSCFFGVNLNALKSMAATEYFQQPIIDTFDIRICLAKSIRHTIDFTTADESELHKIEIPLAFYIIESGIVHGLAFWFDIAFCGSRQIIWLSTSPTEPLTHWYQVRCLLQSPIIVKAGQLLKGSVVLEANEKQSYHITIDISIEGQTTRSVNTFDLKNPYFRYSMPSGFNSGSPGDINYRSSDVNSKTYVDYDMMNENYETRVVESLQPGLIDSTTNLIQIIPNCTEDL